MATSKKRTHRWGKWEYTDAELSQQHKEAMRRGKEAERIEPRARAARYDRKSKRLVIELANGAAFMIPLHLLQGFEGAAPRDVAAVEVMPTGSALHWEKLDLDFGVAGLVAGVFGNKAWMSALGRQGGLAKSEAKARAARANGAKGGRPSKARSA
jgi:hypothetical protein